MRHQVKQTFRAALTDLFKKVASTVRPSHDHKGPTLSSAETVDFLGSSTVSALHPYRKTIVQCLLPGQVIAGRFEILRFLSSGGMGEVYEAWDADLKEKIALKTIRPEIAFSPSAIERFKREVKQARAISHVNVCRVYEVFSHTQPSGDRIWFLTMELLDGETLSLLLKRAGPMPADQALDLIEQMVAGLAAAHDLGLVHRDFKSSNVMLVSSKGGKTRAVVTDFGLAFNVRTDFSGSLDSPGEGTPQYMAPEQKSGGPVGFAADQYALGVVMCEMLTGQRPSCPSSKTRALWPSDRLNPRWQSVLSRCLEFHPEDRFKHVREALYALNPDRRRKNTWIALAASALAATLIGIVFLRTTVSVRRVEGGMQLTPATDLSLRPSLSRDGRFVAYSSDRAETGKMDIWVQQLPSGFPVRITNDPAPDEDASIAPDGSAVVFRSERDGGGIYLAKVPAGGERLLVPNGRNPRFSPDGKSIVYWVGDRDDTVPSGRIFLLSLSDGLSTRLAPDFVDARFPVWSTSGRFILFAGCRAADVPVPWCTEWWATSRDQTTVQNTGALAFLRTEQIQPLDVGGWYRDKILFSGRRGATTSLWELPVLEANLKVSGKPQQLTSGDAREVDPTLADEGTIAFEHFTGALHVWRIDHASNSKTLSTTKITQDAAVDISPSVSTNGRWLVFSRGFGGRRDLWVKETQTATESLFFSSDVDKLWPIIDDSGETIAFEERGASGPSVSSLMRGKPAKTLCTACSNPSGWFDGGRAVFYRSGMPSKIKMAIRETGEQKSILEADGMSLADASWSPENQYLLFTASKDGTTEQVFAVRFPKSTQTVSGKWIPITSPSEFSARPRWSGDGKTIYYISTRDGFSCIWGQHFDLASETAEAKPFAVLHYHNPRFSPASVVARSFNLSVTDDSIYLNVGETNSSIWTGVLRQREHFPFSRFFQ